MAVLPTVKVALGDSYMIINESDFDPSVHALFQVASASGPRGVRRKELENMTWQKIRSIAESFEPPIAKHEDGWEETIPTILSREFGEQG